MDREQWSGPEAHHLRGTAFVDARRPRTALMRQRARKWYAHNVMAHNIIALYHGASSKVTSRNGVDVGEDAAKIVPAGSDRLEVQRRRNAPTPTLSAPGGLAWRVCGDASAHDISATSLRNHSPPNNMAVDGIVAWRRGSLCSSHRTA